MPPANEVIIISSSDDDKDDRPSPKGVWGSRSSLCARASSTGTGTIARVGSASNPAAAAAAAVESDPAAVRGGGCFSRRGRDAADHDNNDAGRGGDTEAHDSGEHPATYGS